MEISITMALANAVTGPEVVALVALMTANVVLSILAAIKNGKFTFRKVGDFAKTRILPLTAYIILNVMAQFIGGWMVAAGLVYAGLVAMYGTGILAAVKALTGVSIPRILTERENESR